MRLYLDSSAIVKLVQAEAESAALRRFLGQHGDRPYVTCALARVEVVRAVNEGGAPAVAKARRQLARLDQVALNASLLDSAAVLSPGGQLRSLDAIHLAAAGLLGAELAGVVTYDTRMTEAARELGMAVEAPA
ncbi:MAG TPA: type II toxin-antitoxin system VapC family toxin [Acidimicrobiales bacterium]|nr:type II toxin-antitoxin system VapC family toxin [Acidimicrobiales bacterium]